MAKFDRTCNRCGKPYRCHGKPGECQCPAIAPSRHRLPELVGTYAQYAEPREWYYICKDAYTTCHGHPDKERHYWDRHPHHTRWIPHWHIRVKVCGYRSVADAKRALRTARLRSQPAYIINSQGEIVG